MQRPAKYEHDVGTATSCRMAPALAAIPPVNRGRVDHGGGSFKARSFSIRGTEKLYSSLQQEGCEETTSWEPPR